MSDFVDEIFRTKVTAQILQKVLAAFATMDPADRRDFTGRAVTVIRVLDEEGLLDKQPHLAAAIEFRLEALACLSHRQELKAWSLPGDIQGMCSIQGVVLEAVAAEPLRQEGNRPTFDADSFFKRLTALSDAAGHG